MTASKRRPGQANLPTPNSTHSYWHRTPSPILLGHQTTSFLPSAADVVIIGSGISGASAARFLLLDDRAKDLHVVMLEAREACWGATGRNGGHCQAMIYHHPEIGAFEVRNYQTIKKLIEDNEIPCDWKSHPVIHSYLTEVLFTAGLQDYENLKSHDPEMAKNLTVVTKSSRSPSLKDIRIPSDTPGAIISNPAASLWPYKLVCWILENLLSLNEPSAPPRFNLQTNTPATHIQKTNDGWIIHTPRGMIATPKLLLTTNAYTSHLLPEFSDLIVPVRGEMSSLIPPPSMKPGSSNPPLRFSYGFVGNGRQNINQDDYLIQRPYSSTGQGELMFGGGRSYARRAGVGISDDSAIDPPAAAYLRQELPKILDLGGSGSDAELEASFEWSGIMGYSRDSHPWVGEVSEELGLGGGKGLWLCAGYTGHGMPNACLSAKAVVGLMLGDDEVDLPDVYRLSKERVSSARVLDEVAVADAKGLR